MKIIKILRHDLSREYAIYLFGSIISSAVPFLLMPILTRFLSPEDYGINSVFTLVQRLLGVLIGLSTYEALTVQYYKVSNEERLKYVSAILTIFLFATLFFLLISISFETPLSRVTNIASGLFPIAVITTFFRCLWTLALEILRLERKALLYSLLQILGSVVTLLFSVFFVVGLHWNWKGQVLGTAISAALTGVLGLYFLRRSIRAIGLQQKVYIRDALKFGIPLIPHALGAWANVSVSRFLLNSMMGLSAVGQFSVGIQFALVITTLCSSFNTAWIPFLFERLVARNPRTERQIVFLTYLYFGGLLAFALLFGLLIPHFLKFWVGPKFLNSSQYILWLVLAEALDGMYLMVGGYISFSKKTHILSMLTVGSALVNIGLTYGMIIVNGSVGAAQATAVSRLIIFVGAWVIANRVYPMPWLLRAKRA